MGFLQEIDEKTAQIEEVLIKYLPKEEGYQKTVFEAMNYSILAGGKRLRPMLMQETFKMFDGKGKVIEPFMAAIEFIHTYSLVHDDLPAMDNDDYRRGKKTTHKIYGEAMGILAGDALLNYAMETATIAFEYDDDAKKVAEALRVLFNKSGVNGMVGGQVVDVESEKDSSIEITKDKLDFIHKNKTGALIEASLMIGGILAGASEDEINQLEKIATNVGIAFQIQDDILDVTSTLEVLGKPIGSDEKNNKSTYVAFEGLEKSKEDVAMLSKEACDMMSAFGKDDSFLQELFVFLIDRKK